MKLIYCNLFMNLGAMTSDQLTIAYFGRSIRISTVLFPYILVANNSAHECSAVYACVS